MKRPDVTIEHARPRRQWRTWAATEPALAGLSWDRFRHELRHGSPGRQDELLTSLVRIARSDPDAVTAVAACLVPGLRARIAAHAPGLAADDAWGEAVAGLCAAIDAVDLSVGFVASRLLDIVRRQLQRAVKHETTWCSHASEVPERAAVERVDEPSGALILSMAAGAGVISGPDAWLLQSRSSLGTRWASLPGSSRSVTRPPRSGASGPGSGGVSGGRPALLPQRKGVGMDSYGERERRRSQAAQHAEFRSRMLGAGGFDDDELTEQGRRILAWLADWDDWTVGGVAEMLSAACRSGLGVGRLERRSVAQDRGDLERRRDSVTGRLDAIERQRPESPEVGL